MQSNAGTPSKWLTLIAACLGLGMLMIDTFVVNVAFPAIGRDLKASLAAAEWTVSGYVLAVGVLPIAMGRAGDILGRRRVYLAGLILFLVSSAASGTAQTIDQLIVFRVLQGVGAATMMPGTLSIITQAFPPQQRGLAIGIWGGVSGLGLIAGPILGGLLVHGDSWRWIFYINIPVGVVALFMTVLFVPESRDESAPRSLDLLGLVLLSVPLFLVMFAITRANDLGWTSGIILGCLVGAVLMFPLFVWVERRIANPLIDFSLFRSRTFVFACASAFLFSGAVFGSQPFTSLFMQNFWGFSPLQGGVAFLPSTVIVAGLMPVSGILGQRLGSQIRIILLVAAVAVGLSFFLQLRLTSASGYVDGFLPSFLLRGLGIGLFMSATSYAVVSSMPVSKSGLASGTLTMARNIGTSMGVAVFGAVFLHAVDTNVPAALAGAPAAQTAQVTAAAEHFKPVGEVGSASRAAVEDEIVQGFVLVCGAAVVTCVLASIAAIAVRPRALVAPGAVMAVIPLAEPEVGAYQPRGPS
jgi:EmrB/QacA subfamily drug resistance transporter